MHLIRYWISLLLLMLASYALAITEPAKLKSIRISASNEKTRLVFILNQLPPHKVFTLADPARLVIDFSNTQLLSSLDIPLPSHSIITKLRSGRGPDNATTTDLRMVLDLRSSVTSNSLSFFILPGSHPNEQRLVLDLYQAKARNNHQPTPALVSNTPVPTVEKTKITPQEMSASTQIVSSQAAAPSDEDNENDTNNIAPVTHASFVAKPPSKPVVIDKVSTQTKEKQRDIIIVIDPGHGGKDPGASGSRGTHEKDIVLAISQRLSDLLAKQPGMHAVLTRRGDYFVPLRGRLRLARKDKADMFIAIHADAFPTPDATGASVFALSASGASSEAARWLAEKENYSELGGVNLEDKSDLLRSVLLDLSQTATISLSLQLGSNMLQELNRITNLHHDSVEQARFVVLKSPDIPSVLVETGFITNSKEEQRLSDPIYQQQLAVALNEGIRRYFIQNPPPNTVFAMRHEAVTQYVAKAGETILSIAKQYGLSPQVLREANQLSSNKITAGQLLHIPVKMDVG